MSLDSINTVATNLDALSEQYRAIANNLANSNTAGFKKNVNSFRNILNNAVAGQATSKAASIKNDVGIDFSSGAMLQTDRRLDLAIDGEGFFTVNTAKGPVYTRAGSFTLNNNGMLVDRQGQIVSSDTGPVTIPQNVDVSEVTIASDGTISAREEILGKLRITNFADTSQLRSIGAGNFVSTVGAQQAPADNVKIVQGYSEQSNVNAVEELVNLIRVSRLYEANAKTISMNDDRTDSLLRIANN